MTISRVVTLLTPVFVGIAGAVSVWSAKHLLGHPTLDQGELTAVFILGGTAAFAQAANWLRGLQKHEAREALGEHPAVVEPEALEE